MSAPRRTLGRRLLAKVLERHTQAEVGDACGVSHRTIGRALTAGWTDSRTLALALQRLYGIPVESWDEDDDAEHGRAA